MADFNPTGDSKMLETLFPRQPRLILSAMFRETGRWWTLTDLAGRAGVQPDSLRPHLVRLRDCGLIREQRDNGRPLFQPNPLCPIFAELQSIVVKLTSVPDSGETILIVEDQPATARITCILLESWGYRVLETHGPEEALRLFDEHADEIKLVLTDVVMPGMEGPQLAKEMLSRRPGLRIVFMSGYIGDQAIGADAAFLPKPFNPMSLSRMVRKELDRGQGLLHKRSRPRERMKAP